jgi:hypothetical protein
MVGGEEVKDYVILGLDIASYSQKPIEEQRDAQEAVDLMLQQALDACRKPAAGEIHWLDAGDGGYALMRWSERDALDVVQHLYERLRRHNKRASDEHQISFRTALHVGQIVHWRGNLGEKYAGHAINACARLLGGMNRSHEDQVICSGEFYDKISSFEPVVNTLRLKDIKDKHGHLHRAYNLIREPGFGIHPLKEERHPDFMSR